MLISKCLEPGTDPKDKGPIQGTEWGLCLCNVNGTVLLLFDSSSSGRYPETPEGKETSEADHGHLA